MTTKSTIISASVAITAVSLTAATWWAFDRTTRPVSIANYETNERNIRRDWPANPTNDRMALPWSSALKHSAGTPLSPVTRTHISKPPPPKAVLPWATPLSSARRIEPVAAVEPVLAPLPSASVADAAAALEFSPAVVAWLGDWEKKVRASDPEAATDVARFERLLKAEGVPVSKLLSLMNAVQMLEDHPQDRHAEPYPPVTGAIACRAVIGGSEQAANDTGRRFLLMRQVSPLIERLWHGTNRDAKAVHTFYCALAIQNDRGVADWYRGRLGSVEALYKLRLYNEALTSAASLLDDDCVTGAYRVEVQWMSAISLIALNRIEDAIPHMHAAASGPDSQNSINASVSLFWLYLRTNKDRDAEDQLIAHVRRFSPPEADILPMIRELSVRQFNRKI